MILPPLARTAADAERFARIVHAGQVDKAGRPYIDHVERVAGRALELAGKHAYEPDRIAQIAWLHDVLEPDERPFKPLFPSSLIAEGFCQAVVDRVVLLSLHPASLTYMQRIECIVAAAQTARGNAVLYVKLADLEDNSDPTRLALLPAEQAESLGKRYARAKAMIREALAKRFVGDCK